MKKNFTQFCLAVIMMIAMALPVTAQGQMYILGSGGVWNPDQATAILTETAEGSGVYVNDAVDFSGGNGWFAVVTQLNESWDVVNSNRYGPVLDSDMSVNGSSPIQKTDKAFCVAGSGIYRVEVDLNIMTCRVFEQGFSVLTTYPEAVYVVGHDNAWDVQNPYAVLAKKEDGVYFGRVTFEGDSQGYSEFKILTQNSWEINFGMSSTYMYTGGEEQGIAYNGRNFKLQKGVYDITIDLRRMTLRIETIEVSKVIRQLYVVGSPTEWDPMQPVATLTETDIDSNIYTGTIDAGEGAEFKILTVLGSWTNNYGSQYFLEDYLSGDINMNLGVDNTNNIKLKGVFDVCVDLNNNTAIFKSISTGVENVMETGNCEGIIFDLGGVRHNSENGLRIMIRNGKKFAR